MILPLCSATKALPSLVVFFMPAGMRTAMSSAFSPGRRRCVQHRAHVKRSRRVPWRAVQHVVQVPTTLASSIELAFGDRLVRVILRVAHLDAKAHSVLRVAATPYSLNANRATPYGITFLSGAGHHSAQGRTAALLQGFAGHAHRLWQNRCIQ